MIPSGKLNFTNAATIQGFNFSDGQPHLKVSGHLSSLVVRIASPQDLLNVCQVADVYQIDRLLIRYLMGGRMDRRIEPGCPQTLKVVCDILNQTSVKSFEVFGVHSDATTLLLRDSRADWDEVIRAHASAIHDCRWPAFKKEFGHPPELMLARAEPKDREISASMPVTLVLPDVGASKSFYEHLGFLAKNHVWEGPRNVVVLNKSRDLATGKLKPGGTKVIDGDVGETCLILDDLCDGGATFTAAAECLRAAGAKWVGLSVLHGIFSKPLPLPGIDHIYTTNSFREREPDPGLSVYKVM